MKNKNEEIRKNLLIISSDNTKSFNGYFMLEVNGAFRCFRVNPSKLIFNFNDTPIETYSVNAEIKDIVTGECDLEKITQSVAYFNILNRYKNLVNKINNKRKELENIEKKIKIKKQLLSEKYQKHLVADLCYGPKLKSQFKSFDEFNA